jgi:hypothetical protein
MPMDAAHTLSSEAVHAAVMAKTTTGTDDAAVSTAPPCHEAPEAAPMECCEGDDTPTACGDCNCVTAAGQAGVLQRALATLAISGANYLAAPRAADPPEPPPGTLLRPPIVLS